jgi:hypothetical protein
MLKATNAADSSFNREPGMRELEKKVLYTAKVHTTGGRDAARGIVMSTGGWGFGRFIDGKPVDEAQHESCFACHSKNMTVEDHDFVFTRLAP